MSEEYESYTRLRRFEKKRKNTKWLTIFITVGTICVLALISIFIFSDIGDDNIANEPDELINDEADQEENEINVDPNNDEHNRDELNGQDDEDKYEADTVQGTYQNPDDFDIEVIESGEDENVIFAYTSTWEPIPTEQSEPHEIAWEQSSQDWKEMMMAAELATGIHMEDMYYLWVSGNGPKSVIATFSDSTMEEHFRVYITWVEHQGWKPDKVEMLNENDQLYRFNAE